MPLYLSLADTSIFIPYIAFIALFVGGIASFLGVGGGFILTPLLITFGVPPFIAVGTGTTHIFFGSLNAVKTYHRQKAIPYKVATLLTIGGAIGALAGTLLLKYMASYTESLDFILRISFVVLLLGIAILLWINPKSKILPNECDYSAYRKYHFFGIGTLIGIISGFLGIGGGFLIVPILIYIMSLKKADAMAISQFNIMCVTAVSLCIHIFINHNVDWVLALILIVFGVIGSQIGLLFSFKVSENISRYIFLFIVLVTVAMLIYKF